MGSAYLETRLIVPTSNHHEQFDALVRWGSSRMTEARRLLLGSGHWNAFR